MLLCSQFERIIAVNTERGYELESWQLRQVLGKEGNSITETIVAVFVEQHGKN